MNQDIVDAVEQVLAMGGPFYSVADLAVGDRTLVDLLDLDEESKFVGDGQPGQDYQGSVDEILPEMPYVHLFILNGQIRGLADVLATFYRIREKSAVVLVVDWEDDNWPATKIAETLTKAGLQPSIEMPVTTPDGVFHVWLCKNASFSRPDDAAVL